MLTLYPQKCIVWCSVMIERVIGPYFSENEEGQFQRINDIRQCWNFFFFFFDPDVEDNQKV